MDDFEEAFHDRALHFMASTLERVGFERREEITNAIERAMRICSHCGVHLEEHFKTIYIADDASQVRNKRYFIP